MNLDDMKKELNVFIKDLFHGFSTSGLATADTDKLERLHLISEGWKEKQKTPGQSMSFNELLWQYVNKYVHDQLTENQIKHFFTLVLASRSVGLIMNDSNSASSLKMENLRLEDRVHDLEKENELLAEQLAQCRSILDSQKVKFDAVK